MFLRFSLLEFFTKLFCAGIFTCAVTNVSGQTIQNGDGSSLKQFWCNDDTLHHIIGEPAGGSFSGCGVIEINGQWYFNPVVATSGTDGVYNCMLTYTPLQGDPVSKRIDVFKHTINFLEDSIITCDGSFYLLVTAVLPVGADNWNWSPGAALDDSTQKGTGGVTYEDAYYVYRITNGSNGCTTTDTVYVYYEGVRAEASASKDTICVHEVVDFSADFQDATYGYTWNSGDGVAGSGTAWQHAYIQDGIYDATLIVNNEHCKDTAIIPIVVRGFDIELSASTLLADRGTPLTLQTASGESYRVTAWYPNELFSDQSAYNQQTLADTTRTYTVVGESAYGCIDSAEVTVEVNPLVFIPSSFSPNGDGRNDFFRVVAWGDPIAVTQFRVYDRWGREVWAANGANALTGWDGTLNGAPAEMGVYFYVFEGTLPSGVTTAQQGDVTLLR